MILKSSHTTYVCPKFYTSLAPLKMKRAVFARRNLGKNHLQKKVRWLATSLYSKASLNSRERWLMDVRARSITKTMNKFNTNTDIKREILSHERRTKS